VILWMHNRATAIDSTVAHPFGLENTPPTVFANKAIDGTRWWMWEAYRFSQRIGGELLDEKLLNGIETATDKNLNRFRLQPAEIVVAPGAVQSTPGQPTPVPSPTAANSEPSPATVPPPAPPAP
jgi:hypothetical protein